MPVINLIIGSLRAVIEMLGLCLLGQALLFVLVGRQRAANPIYRLFELVTTPPRKLMGHLLPKNTSSMLVGFLTFIMLFLLWIGLAILRKFV